MLNQSRSDWVHNTIPTGLTQDFEGYRDTALRGQWLYEPHKDFSLLANLHARDLNGSARLFRANIIQPGTNDLVTGFDERQISTDGKNEQELTTTGGSLRLRWGLGPVALYSITGYEHVKAYSRGDIDGGFGAVFAPPSGPGLIPFSSETADGMPKHQQWTQEFRVESNTPGPLSWQAGLYFFHEDYNVESFSYDSLTGGSPQDGYVRIAPEERRLCGVRRRQLRGHAGLQACAAACATRTTRRTSTSRTTTARCSARCSDLARTGRAAGPTRGSPRRTTRPTGT